MKRIDLPDDFGLRCDNCNWIGTLGDLIKMGAVAVCPECLTVDYDPYNPKPTTTMTGPDGAEYEVDAEGHWN